MQNSPNPFSASTTIRLRVPDGLPYSVQVYDVAGRLVNALGSVSRSGEFISTTWDATDSHGQRVPSGIYFYRLTAPGHSITKKMILIK